MNFLVTGAAGFIGSSLSERLLEQGHTVTGIDCFSDYYPRALKEANLNNLRGNHKFKLVDQDIADLDLAPLLEQNDAIIHLAAQAGVRTSWGANFNHYLHNNIAVTQKLLEAMKGFPFKRLVYASSSSVYGQATQFPTPESAPTRPLSPYGVSKLAAENLCWLYQASYGLSVVALRFFTVYGPRQRPDMAFHRFIRAMLEGREIVIWGNGRQSRDFTFVDDIISATISAATANNAAGKVFNLGGGVRASIQDVIAILEDKLALKARIQYNSEALGDVRDTFADTSSAKEALNFDPAYSLEDGLVAEIKWVKENLHLLQTNVPGVYS